MKIIIKTSVILFLLLSFLYSTGQEIIISADDTPLNEVLIGIIDSYNVSISFDDESLRHYNISVNKTYPSLDKAINGLLIGVPFTCELVGGVWVIYPEKEKILPRPKLYITGRILDKITKEPLPYSHIIVNGWPSISDLKGSYTAVTENFDSIVNVKVTHLGYYIFDTVVSANQIHNF